MAIPPFRLAFWTLIACLGLTTLLALVGSPAVAEPELRPRRSEPGLTIQQLPLPPDPRTRRRLAEIEERLDGHDQRLDDGGKRIDRHDDLHCADSKGLAELERQHDQSVVEINRRLGEGETRLTSVERRLDEQAKQLAAIRKELREIADREPIVPPAETNLLFVPFPRPVVLTAERIEPPAPPEPPVDTSPISLRVEIEAVEIEPKPKPLPAPVPQQVLRPAPICDPCAPFGPQLAWPATPMYPR